MRIALYVLAIIAANIVTAHYAPFEMWGLLVPQGTFLIGLTFILRDLVQMKYGKRDTYIVIGIALVLSAMSTEMLGNGIRIVVASAISFALSEALDTEIFTRWRGKLLSRVFLSGAAGSIVDSFIFTLVAGFPIRAAYGQLIIKTVMQLAGVAAIAAYFYAKRLREQARV